MLVLEENTIQDHSVELQESEKNQAKKKKLKSSNSSVSASLSNLEQNGLRCAKEGNLKEVGIYLDSIKDSSQLVKQDEQGKTILHYIAKFGWSDFYLKVIAQWFRGHISSHQDYQIHFDNLNDQKSFVQFQQIKDHEGNTVFHEAVLSHKLDMCRWVSQIKCNATGEKRSRKFEFDGIENTLFIENEKGDAPFHIAALHGFDAFISDLVRKSHFYVIYDDDYHRSLEECHAFRTMIYQKYSLPVEKNKCIHLAAMRGHPSAVSEINKLSLGRFVGNALGTVHDKNKEGHTALHLAVLHGHLPVVNQLFKDKVNLSIKDNEGQTAYQLALKLRKEELNKKRPDANKIKKFNQIVKSLESKQKRIDGELSKAFKKKDNESLLQELLNQGARMEVVIDFKKRETNLHQAIRNANEKNGNAKIIQNFLQKSPEQCFLETAAGNDLQGFALSQGQIILATCIEDIKKTLPPEVMDAYAVKTRQECSEEVDEKSSEEPSESFDFEFQDKSGKSTSRCESQRSLANSKTENDESDASERSLLHSFKMRGGQNSTSSKKDGSAKPSLSERKNKKGHLGFTGKNRSD